MCLLVIMCALALIRTGTGAVIMADKTGDSGDPAECVHECVPRCRELLRTRDSRCCDCPSFCEMTCGVPLTPSSVSPMGLGSTPPCTPGQCDLPYPVGRSPATRRRRPSRSPTMREAALIARSVGLDLGPLGGEEEGSRATKGSEVGLRPRLASLVHGRDDVTALVSWGSAPLAWYLVTWEPQGGGVRGNLLVNSTSASLTLRPDTVYRVQVASAASRASSCLEVDTRAPAPPRAQGHARGYVTPSQVLGGVAALATFLLLLGVAVRWRRTPLKASESPQDLDRFKLYPPPVTLRCLADEMRTSPRLTV